MGHYIRVSDRHYLQVPEELYEKVARVNDDQNATKSATNSDVAEGEDSHVPVNTNRGDWIRTSDLLLPKQRQESCKSCKYRRFYERLKNSRQ